MVGKLSAKEKAVDFLSRREYAALELRRKLLSKGYDELDVEEAMAFLIDKGWQSDERYAESLVNTRAKQGYGPLRIGMELKQNGVDEQIINHYLRKDDLRWQRQLGILWKKRMLRHKGEPQRILRYFQQRGYQQSWIIELIKSGDCDVDVDEPN